MCVLVRVRVHGVCVYAHANVYACMHVCVWMCVHACMCVVCVHVCVCGSKILTEMFVPNTSATTEHSTLVTIVCVSCRCVFHLTSLQT